MKDFEHTITNAIVGGEYNVVKKTLTSTPELVQHDFGPGSWLHIAARTRDVKMNELLIKLGCDVNAEQDNSSHLTVLHCAVGNDDPPVVELLLKNGANPNQRSPGPLITAITGNKKKSLALVQILDRYGADLHDTYSFGGKDGEPMNALKMAIQWEKDDVVEYLRSRSCVLPEEGQPAAKPQADSLDEEVVAYFEEHFGRVKTQALIEIVPTEPPIAVHVVPADDGRDYVTLFTTGMSAHPMNVPARKQGRGDEDFRFAELYIQLPAGWKYMDVEDEDHGWPIHWLRSMAKYPHQRDTWLGGAFTLVANGDPPKPLAPSVGFTTLMMMADRRFVSHESRTIQLYRLLPLYTEELELEKSEGAPALMRALDDCDTPFVVDVNRRNVAKR